MSRHVLLGPWFTAVLVLAMVALAGRQGSSAASAYSAAGWHREAFQQTVLAAGCAVVAAGWFVRFCWEVRRDLRSEATDKQAGARSASVSAVLLIRVDVNLARIGP
ncbi:hypothetical protein GCM10020369_20200 [Cryptosporangium minutisporangium]|uniref:Uncharacterized protein n=1 Tax=Cryptosporangium minutisporangium TaxID=113569 RepID=A0ABP6SV71_9ACTN